TALGSPRSPVTLESRLNRDVPGSPEIDVPGSPEIDGRGFESVYTNHRYTQKEREILFSHESFDYLPSHSPVYKEWLRRQPA
ncbi:hypothetical protein LSAT2_018671, partial [Lamellibrachia satsuma]